MSAVYRVLLTMTLFVSTVASQAGTIINVYSPDSPNTWNKNIAPRIEATSPVVFSVGRKSSYAPSSGSRILMDHTFYSKGEYFDMETSIFTAPLSGIYGFYFGASSVSGKRIYLFLKVGKPEKSIASTYNYNTIHGQASGFVFVEMKKGDHASMWVAGGQAIHQQNNPSTHFSGFLVTPLGVDTTKRC